MKLNGVTPKRGMWLISPSRKKLYGQILKVTSTEIVWRHEGYQLIFATPYVAIDPNKYAYVKGRPLDYIYTGPGEQTDESDN